MKLTRAKVTDIATMKAVVQPEVKNGTILHRSDDEIAMHIRSYVIARDNDGEIMGYAALHIHSPTLAEIRSLIVASKNRGKSIGTKMVKYLLEEAGELGLKEVLSLTYEPAFFQKLHFIEIPKESIPEHKIWADCVKCIHFPICNEISLIYTIKQEAK